MRKKWGIIGVDEVGRGALAGPLVACALRIVKPSMFPFGDVTDSKLLSDAERRKILPAILKSCRVQYGAVSSRFIDRVGVQQVNVLAIELALKNFAKQNSSVYCDYIAAFWRYATHTFDITLHVGGELMYPEIAAASIAAKVYRDDLMIRLSERHPRYGFARHKGYGTTQHRQVLRRLGRSAVHRVSFAL